MATREALSNTDLSSSNWTTGSPIHKAQVAPTVSSPYLFATGLGQNSAASYVDLSIYDVGAGTLYEQVLEQYNGSDYTMGGGIGGGTGNPLYAGTFAVTLQGGSAGSCFAKDTHALSLEPHADDEYADSLGTSTITTGPIGTTATDKATLTFTPATAGDYLIVASAMVKYGSTAAGAVEAQLTIDGTVAGQAFAHRPVNASGWDPWMMVIGCIGSGVNTFDALTAASHTIKIQFASQDNSNTASIKQARILALRLDTFTSVYYAEALSRQTTTSTTPVTKLSNAPTIANSGNHLIFACAQIDGTSGSGRFTDADITSGGTSLFNPNFYPTRSAGADDSVIFLARMESLSSGASATNTWTIDIARDGSGGIGGVGVENAAICVIELAEPSTVKDVTLGRIVGSSEIVLACTSS